MMDNKIRIEKRTDLKEKPKPDQLGFGQYFTDHMFLMDYSLDQGWHDPRIVPYSPLILDPASMVFHYGQAVFEGLKAFKTTDDKIRLFRADRNMARLNISNARLEIPAINETFMIKALKTLIRLDQSWIPQQQGTSLYIRPFIIATEPGLGVRPSHRYLFIIILTPVGNYYSEGIKPLRINVENSYVRAVQGGTGFAKTSGNYAASLRAQAAAKQEGYAQVLWLDGIEKKYIEEVGSMNVFFKVNGEVLTPALNGSILDGVTRNAIITLLREWGIPISERKVSIEELYIASREGKLEEAFGSGTGAVISPIGELNWQEQTMIVNQGHMGKLTARLYETITGIQNGSITDTFGWTDEV
jgi:branched-chain amino acid aminotransferase